MRSSIDNVHVVACWICGSSCQSRNLHSRTALSSFLDFALSRRFSSFWDASPTQLWTVDKTDQDCSKRFHFFKDFLSASLNSFDESLSALAPQILLASNWPSPVLWWGFSLTFQLIWFSRPASSSESLTIFVRCAMIGRLCSRLAAERRYGRVKSCMS